MKYQLTNIIHSLSKEEIRNFKTYSQRYQYKGEKKKLILLFDLIKKAETDEYDEKLVFELFPKGSKNSYYQLKNRLIAEIENSLLLLHRDVDHDARIFKLLQLTDVFISKFRYQEANKYLDDALKIAKEHDKYDLLSIIYDKYIYLATHLPGIDFGQFIQDSKVNDRKRAYNHDNHLLISSLTYQLFQSNFSQKNQGEVAVILQQTVDKLELDSEFTASPKTKFRIHKCIREVLLTKKEFEALSDYMLECLAQFEEENLFNKATNNEKIVMISWAINALTKVKKFEEAERHIEMLEEAMNDHNGVHFDKYKWTLFLSKATHYAFTNRNISAINLLNSLKIDEELSKIRHFNVMIWANLSVLHFSEGNMEEAIDNISNIVLDTSFKQVSPSLQLSLLVVEVVLRVQAKDFEYAKNQYQKLRRKFRTDLTTDSYERERNFLEIIRSIIQKRSLDMDGIEDRAQEFIDVSPAFEPGSNEAINYAIWLKSLLVRKSYYQLILEELGQNV